MQLGSKMLNGNFVEPCIHKPRKCTKPDNSQNLNIGCFLLKMFGVKDKKNSHYRSVLNMKKFVKC